MAATSIQSAGYCTLYLFLEIVTTLSSRGCLNASNTLVLYLVSSSKNNTPLDDNVSSPGFGVLPPPTRAASVRLVCGVLNGLLLISILSFSNPAVLYIFVISVISSMESLGKIPGIRLAIIDFPLPGEPIKSRLCIPHALIKAALFAMNCPQISLKSTSKCESSSDSLLSVKFNSFFLFRKSTTSLRVVASKMSIPSTYIHSDAFPEGTIIYS